MEEGGEGILFFFSFFFEPKKLSRAYITKYTMGLCGSSGAFEHFDIYTFSFYLSHLFFAFAKSPKVLCKISERIECIYHQGLGWGCFQKSHLSHHSLQRVYPISHENSSWFIFSCPLLASILVVTRPVEQRRGTSPLPKYTSRPRLSIHHAFTHMFLSKTDDHHT